MHMNIRHFLETLSSAWNSITWKRIKRWTCVETFFSARIAVRPLSHFDFRSLNAASRARVTHWKDERQCDFVACTMTIVRLSPMSSCAHTYICAVTVRIVMVNAIISKRTHNAVHCDCWCLSTADGEEEKRKSAASSWALPVPRDEPHTHSHTHSRVVSWEWVDAASF